ncbi:MAG: monovalent cation/H(+) antiporter subunit G [Actinomycetota bacterium]|nr:monovalent cation/H(+) antiporter subunit G [Actinomycetota bacterium]
MRDVVASALVLSGVAFVLVAAIGLLRFPDLFARMHAATKAATLGLLLVLAGAALRLTHVGDVAQLVLVAVLMFLTAPVGAHMIARAASRTGEQISPSTFVDELAVRRATREKTLQERKLP